MYDKEMHLMSNSFLLKKKNCVLKYGVHFEDLAPGIIYVCHSLVMEAVSLTLTLTTMVY